MSHSNLTIPDALSTNASGFLAAVNGNASDGGLSGLFQDLLNATQSLPPTVGNQSSTSHSASAPNNNDTGSTGASPTLSQNIGEIIGALKDFSAKWQSVQSHSTSQNQTPVATKDTKTTGQSSNSSSTPSSQTPTTSSSNNSPTTATASDTSGTAASTTPDHSSTTGNDTKPSWSDLIAELQSIMQMLQQNLPTQHSTAASPGSATTATHNDSITTPQELLNAGNALGDLLGLVQKMEKKFDPTSSSVDVNSANATPAATVNVTPDTNSNLSADLLQTPTDNTIVPLAALDDRLKTDLKTLIDALKSATNNYINGHATNTTTAASVNTTTAASVNTNTPTTTASTDTASAGLNVTMAATTPTSQPVTAKDILQATINVANDSVKQIDNLYPPSTPSNSNAALLTMNAVTASDRGANLAPNEDQTPGGNTTASISPQLQGAASGESTKSANPYSFASQLSATRAQNGGTTGLPSAIEQVLLQLNRNAKSGNDQMRLQLHPADLGTINIKLDFASNGTVTGTVTANNADTLVMLQKDSRSLERALQEAGLRADPGSLQFSLGQQSNPNQTGQNGHNQSAAGSANTDAMNDSPASLDIDTATTESWVVTPGRVNIQV